MPSPLQNAIWDAWALAEALSFDVGEPRRAREQGLASKEILEALMRSLDDESPRGALGALSSGAAKAMDLLRVKRLDFAFAADADLARVIESRISVPYGVETDKLARFIGAEVVFRDPLPIGDARDLVDGSAWRARELVEILKPFEKRGRVFVPPRESKTKGVPILAHDPKGGSRNARPQCRCAMCVSKKILRDAEKLFGVKLAPDNRGRPPK